MTESYDGRQVVGIDLHRRRSVIVRMTEDGRKLETVRITNSPAALQAVIGRAGKNPRVVIEATYGWYWAVDALEAAGAEVHLAHPLGVKAYSYRRVKNDERDAADLADLLRMGRLPEAWIAPPEIRELREISRYRHQLVKARTSLKDQVHGVLAKLGIPVTHSDIFGVHGQAWLDELKLPQPYAGKVASLRQLAGELSAEITLLDTVLSDLLAGHEGYAAIQQLPGIGPVLAAVIVAEIGDIRRFPGPGQLGSWAGLTPRHYESDTKVIRGHVTKQGSRMLRFSSALGVSGCLGVAFDQGTRPAGASRVSSRLCLVSRAERGVTGVTHVTWKGGSAPGRRGRGSWCSAARTGRLAYAA
jgi:transposase